MTITNLDNTIQRVCDHPGCMGPMDFDGEMGVWRCRLCGAEADPPSLGDGCADPNCPDHYNGPAPYCIDAEARWRKQVEPCVDA